MTFREFNTEADLCDAVTTLLKQHLEISSNNPQGLMLTGGNTIRDIYTKLSNMNIKVSENLHIILSDERYVPVDSPDSNYGFIHDLIEKLDVPNENVIKPDTQLPINDCADKYHQDLSTFMKNGSIPLGILGLGSDGHLASLFSIDDLNAGNGRFAQAVTREEGPDRISVSRDFLLEIDQIVFIAVGDTKKPIIDQLQANQNQVVAGIALKKANNVSVWYC